MEKTKQNISKTLIQIGTRLRHRITIGELIELQKKVTTVSMMLNTIMLRAAAKEIDKTKNISKKKIKSRR